MGGVWSWFVGGARCPAEAEEKRLVEEGFQTLEGILGRERMTRAVIEPTPAFFPDRYDPSEEAARRLFARVCGYMAVDPACVQLSFWNDEGGERDVQRLGMAAGPKSTSGASGLYSGAEGRERVWIHAEELKDPAALVATVAHEVTHVLLLGQRGMPHNVPHMEALTDLGTIFLGFGIFTANALLRRDSWSDGRYEGWQVRRKGYISPEMAGWALALFCWEGGERDPRWARHLTTDPREYLKMGCGIWSGGPGAREGTMRSQSCDTHSGCQRRGTICEAR